MKPILKWTSHPNNCLTSEAGGIQVLIEEVGWQCRYVISRRNDASGRRQVVSTGSAREPDQAKRLAEDFIVRKAGLKFGT
ncbi:hypothetical protein [Rhodovastum atsumiense]|uniref:WGR domain-containing protein n=1 Tax=Rhodovastum atsumiense TaxID=504468 RepID=A0A5M6IUF4_9PROT|nr:hypothetical protein [Rhodovastum atsumiense]KAA5611178.1 hypothetical protein F1189_15525 [Rhodovastum atsumiense]